MRIDKKNICAVGSLKEEWQGVLGTPATPKKVRLQTLLTEKRCKDSKNFRNTQVFEIKNVKLNNFYMNKSEETLREDIRTIRRSLKITQKEMGEKLNITESAYNRIESGDISISYAHLLAISDAFGMPIVDILK